MRRWHWLAVGLVGLGLVGGCGSATTEASDGETVESSLTSGGVTVTLAQSSDWGGGYCSDVTLKNAGTSAVTSWQLLLGSGGSTLSQIWSATFTTSGTNVTVKPLDYNKGIPVGGSVSFGFCGNGTGRPTLGSLTLVTAGGGTGGAGGVAGTGGTAGTAGTAGAGGTAGTSGSAGTAGSGGKAGAGGTAGTAGAGGGAGTAGAAGSGGSAGALPKLKIYIAGDSTVSTYTNTASTRDQAGWGQMLGARFNSSVTVDNRAIGGRTARHFTQEGRLDAILSLIKPGDYFLVQFGTNESNTTATYVLNGVTYPYYAASGTDFKTYLQPFIDGARTKQAIPVLVTPPPRNSAYCGGGRSLANYGQAMLEMGQAQSVAVIDLGLATHSHLKAICPKPTTAATENFFFGKADGTIDGTHFQENGATIMAGFVAAGTSTASLGLAAYRLP